jgi:hypothetical protein
MAFLFGFIIRQRSVVRKLVVPMANFIVDRKENLDSTGQAVCDLRVLLELVACFCI